jgi:histidyl-tRNA synthetase
MATFQPVRGTQSLLGEDADRMAAVVAAFDRVRRLYGFKRVEVPVLEQTAVFARTMGETTDVVSKEMYSFTDKGGEQVTLRPEFTAGIARAYLSEGWQQFAPLKVATHGPAFRYERPQKGRFRQFHQLDAEIIGAGEPAADVELLAFADQLLKELGIGGVTLQLNTLGDPATRDAWRGALVEHFKSHRSDLSDDSLSRLERNPLRILDSKDVKDRAVAASAPAIDEHLTAEAADFFAAVTAGLVAVGVAWERNPRLVRGLDYYRHTAFEFVTDQLGAQGTVLAGGRYDGLIEQLGGPHTPAVGWAAGIERLAMLIDHPGVEISDVVVIPMSSASDQKGRELLAKLRNYMIHADMAFRGNLKKRLQKASSAGARFAVLIGDDELARGEAGVKNLQTGDQVNVPFAEIPTYFSKLLHPIWNVPPGDFDFVGNERDE